MGNKLSRRITAGIVALSTATKGLLSLKQLEHSESHRHAALQGLAEATVLAKPRTLDFTCLGNKALIDDWWCCRSAYNAPIWQQAMQHMCSASRSCVC